MSAYICEKKVFVYLITAALSPTLTMHGSNFSWYHAGERHYLPVSDFDRAAEVANMLWLENISSVGHRYRGDKTSANLPGQNSGSFVVTAQDLMVFCRIDPVQVLKTADCLEYQSCEHPGWPESESFAFLDAIRGAAINALPGYHSAKWGAPDLIPAFGR